jgi:hypothetical protein
MDCSGARSPPCPRQGGDFCLPFEIWAVSLSCDCKNALCVARACTGSCSAPFSLLDGRGMPVLTSAQGAAVLAHRHPPGLNTPQRSNATAAGPAVEHPTLHPLLFPPPHRPPRPAAGQIEKPAVRRIRAGRSAGSWAGGPRAPPRSPPSPGRLAPAAASPALMAPAATAATYLHRRRRPHTHAPAGRQPPGPPPWARAARSAAGAAASRPRRRRRRGRAATTLSCGQPWAAPAAASPGPRPPPPAALAAAAPSAPGTWLRPARRWARGRAPTSSSRGRPSARPRRTGTAAAARASPATPPGAWGGGGGDAPAGGPGEGGLWGGCGGRGPG